MLSKYKGYFFLMSTNYYSFHVFNAYQMTGIFKILLILKMLKMKISYFYPHFFFNFVYLFLAALGLCCCARAFSSCGEWASHCGDFSCCRARALGVQASVVVARRLSSCGSRALERRLSSCGARAQFLRGMWDLPGPGLELVSPALAGRFLTTAPPGQPYPHFEEGKIEAQ